MLNFFFIFFWCDSGYDTGADAVMTDFPTRLRSYLKSKNRDWWGNSWSDETLKQQQSKSKS